MTTIPLNKLVPAKANVRKTGSKDSIEELAASIAAHGLLTSLAVRKSARGKFTVIAGQRRYHALSMLAGRDQIAADHPVLCQVLGRDADATEIGLAENVVRIAMHPADQFEAFRALIDKGAGITDIAARFGISEATVAKRLKLGRVCPAILDAYRAGELGLEQVQAFALSEDRKAQQRVWKYLGSVNCNPSTIRRMLTEGEIPATDLRLRFIGLDAYEAAGGAVRRGLFDDENGGYAQNAALLDRLVQEKLETLAESVRDEGWSWVEVHPQLDYGVRSQFHRCPPQQSPLPEPEAAELDRLRDEHSALLENEYGDDEDESADTERLQALEQRIEELEAGAYAWTAEQMATAGAVVHLSAEGEAEVERGLVRPEDAAEDGAATEDTAEDADAPSPAPSLPATVIADLTAQKTAALRATLARQPDVALAAVTHALARQAFYSRGGDTCLDITIRQRSLTMDLAERDACIALSAFDAERATWTECLPGSADELWDWCMRQTQDTLLSLLAVSAASTLNAVRERSTPENAARLLHADALAKALLLDMHAWFTPTAANYFGRVNRSFIIDALTEAGRPARTRRWSKLKKTELAAFAERDIHGTGWLPKPLRSVADVVPFDAEQTDMPVAAAA